MLPAEILARLPSRIAARIRVGAADACWLWTGGCDDKGYGVAGLGKRRAVHVSRLVLEAKLGRKLERQEETRHSCDNPPCCNPDHLDSGSHVDNMRDMVSRGRSARGDRNGSRKHPECLARGKRNGAKLHPETRARGGRHGHAKLTEGAIPMILDLRSQGFTQRAIAAKVGCSQANVSLILLGKAWCSVTLGKKAAAA